MNYNNSLDREDMLEIFIKLDNKLMENAETLELILGGAANVILPEISERLTVDIDTLTNINKIYEYRDFMEDLTINCDMLKIVAIPDGYERRAWLYESYNNLDIYLLDEYDFIISKLGINRPNSHKDMDDIQLTIENYEERFGYASFDYGLLKERLENVLRSHVGDSSTFKINFNYLAHQGNSKERVH